MSNVRHVLASNLVIFAKPRFISWISTKLSWLAFVTTLWFYCHIYLSAFYRLTLLDSIPLLLD